MNTTPTDQHFEAIVQQEGSFVFIAIPFAPRAVWGTRLRYPVVGTINEVTVRGTLGVQAQAYFLRVSKPWLRASRIAVGDVVSVVLQPIS
ncbi:MAG: DUF1905 domain-containing protein [Roseiflexaceae bacterium]